MWRYNVKCQSLGIPDVLLITPDVFSDDRGFFMESWNEQQFELSGINAKFVQDNHSYTGINTLRGLHYQIFHPQGKLVRVVTGSVFDVAVDLRKSSPHFGMWVGITLTEKNHQMLWIPPGFAHGFYVLSKSANFLYKTTEYYDPTAERCIIWNDPVIDIDWPTIDYPTVRGFCPLVSDKDANGMLFSDAPTFD